MKHIPTNSPATHRPFSSRQSWLIGLFILAATVIAYQPVWHAGFIWDDDNFLLNNPLIRQPDGLCRFWFTTTAPDYFPMTSSTLWLEWRLWGENALGYHLVNVFLHACSAVLWWRVLQKLRMPVAWLAAALFALHPVNVESVAWITERKNTLAMFFYVAALLGYLQFEDTGRKQWYGWSIVMFLLALLSKTAPVTLPFIILGIAWWRRGQIERKDLWRSAPFFAISLLLGLVTVWFQYNRAIGDELVRTESFLARLAGAGWAIWFYLGKAILPLNLSFVYPRWQIDASKIISYVPLALAMIGLALCWLYRGKWGKDWLLGFGYFVLMLLPVLGFLNIYFMRYSLVADHWQYFAMMGPIALIAAGVERLANASEKYKSVIIFTLGGTLLLLCGVLTWHQSSVYSDVETLWRKTIALNPGSAMAHNCLGDDLLQKGRLDEALVCFEKSLELQPNDALVHNNRAMALLRLGRAGDAVASLEKALRITVRNGEPQNNLAWLLATCPATSVRNGARALELALQADQLSGSKNPMFMETLAAAYAERGRFDEAIATAKKALELAINKKDLVLVETLKARIELYGTGAPFRDETLVPDH